MKSDFAGYVLAGGKSSRMGSDKYALELAGETFLKRAAHVLEPVCETVRIVLNARQNIAAEYPIIRDIFEERGAPGAIHAALADCAADFAVILAVDLPLVTTAALKNLARLAQESNTFPAIVPRQPDGRPQPLCAVYRPPLCLPPLENLLRENEKVSVRDFLDLISPAYVDAARLSNDENLLFNVNFPADFQKLN